MTDKIQTEMNRLFFADDGQADTESIARAAVDGLIRAGQISRANRAFTIQHAVAAFDRKLAAEAAASAAAWKATAPQRAAQQAVAEVEARAARIEAVRVDAIAEAARAVVAAKDQLVRRLRAAGELASSSLFDKYSESETTGKNYAAWGVAAETTTWLGAARGVSLGQLEAALERWRRKRRATDAAYAALLAARHRRAIADYEADRAPRRKKAEVEATSMKKLIDEAAAAWPAGRQAEREAEAKAENLDTYRPNTGLSAFDELELK